MKIAQYLAGDPTIGLSEFHKNQLKIDREIGKKHAIQGNLTASSL